jgi:hypothetical protein
VWRQLLAMVPLCTVLMKGTSWFVARSQRKGLTFKREASELRPFLLFNLPLSKISLSKNLFRAPAEAITKLFFLSFSFPLILLLKVVF